MKEKKLKAMVAGHICLDITPVFDKNSKGSFGEIFSPGKLINVENAVIGTGGAVSNTGLAMSKLGVDVRLNSKVGDDEFGKIIKNIVGEDRACSFKTVFGQSTSYSIVIALPDIDRVFLHHSGTNDTFRAADIDYETLSQCNLLHFGYPTLMRKMYENNGAELIEIFKRAKELGVITSLDMTLPDSCNDSGKADWKKILSRVLPYVDIFLPSVEEISYMLDRNLFETSKQQSKDNDPVFSYKAEDCSRFSEELIDMGAAVVAIKNGIRGYYLRTADIKRIDLPGVDKALWSQREMWAASYKAQKFGSATGAGDATIAGFLTAFMKGFEPVKCIKAANSLGWQNVRQVDALSGIEDWQTTADMICDNSKELNPLSIKSSGWQYDALERVFYGPNDKGNL